MWFYQTNRISRKTKIFLPCFLHILPVPQFFYFLSLPAPNFLSNFSLGGFDWIKIAVSFALILAVSAVVVVLPMRAGLRRLEEMETL